MAGNVWEWVDDWYRSDTYQDSPGENPRGPATGTEKALRGGAWDPTGGDSRSTDRGALAPESRGNTIGFRCALSSAPPTPAPATVSPTPIPATPTPRLRGQIAFVTDRYGYSEICVVNADGSGLRRLTSNEIYDWHPNWSPDGARLVFVTNRNGPGTDEIYLMNANGSHPVRLTRNGVKDDTPTWHPDGSRIFFSSLRDGNWELYSMRPDGSDVQRLTDHPALDRYPTIAPSGQRMAFVSERNGNPEIYVARGDGTEVVQLTHRGEKAGAPAWSPQGDWIVFASQIAQDQWELYLIRTDGSGLRLLTRRGGEQPAWSPDGTQVAFFDYRGGTGHLYVIDIDSGKEQRVKRSLRIDWSPTWTR
jgi:TolB protein